MEIKRVFDLLELNLAQYAKPDLLAAKYSGEWVKFSTQEVVDTANNISFGLLKLGIVKEDRIGLMSPNRPEWNMVDFGTQQIGATLVPMYPTLSEQDIKFIINDAEIKTVFVANQELYDKIAKVRSEIPSLQAIYSFDDITGVKSWKEVVELGKGGDLTALAEQKAKVLPDDLLTLIYTSGTTGNPKGVMLTHNNLVTNFVNSSVFYPKPFDKALSFLPMSHIFERMVVYMYFYLGISVYYAESLETIVANLQEVKPDGFTTVPRLLEKVYDRIVSKGAELTGIKKTLFFWALNLGLRYENDGKNGWWYEFQLKIANKLIFTKWREALGGNIKALVSGGAALQPRLARVFWAAGIPVLQGYGLTETSPVISVNGLGKGENRFGSSGTVLKDVEVKIAEDGEILARGPNVMKGYYKRPDLTAEVIDKDGWFHTGDIGVLEDGKYLRITDRKKEIFKTAGGKYIAPQILENKFKESLVIEQIMVIGENERFPAALIVPSFANLKEWCTIHGIEYTSNQEMVKHPQVLEKFRREIDKYNEDFGQWEKVKKFEVLPYEWSIDGGEMTPKMSLKRKIIMQKNQELIEKIYRSNNDQVEA